MLIQSSFTREEIEAEKEILRACLETQAQYIRAERTSLTTMRPSDIPRDMDAQRALLNDLVNKENPYEIYTEFTNIGQGYGSMMEFTEKKRHSSYLTTSLPIIIIAGQVLYGVP